MKLPDGWLFTPKFDDKNQTEIVIAIEQTELVRC